MDVYPKLPVVAGIALIISCNSGSTPKETLEGSSAVE
jgi:hypothetical protein